MKIRESGMPERGSWEKFFNPSKILASLGLDSQINDVVEFGCGYGTFTIPAAALDIEPEWISGLNQSNASNGLRASDLAIRLDMI